MSDFKKPIAFGDLLDTETRARRVGDDMERGRLWCCAKVDWWEEDNLTRFVPLRDCVALIKISLCLCVRAGARVCVTKMPEEQIICLIAC